MKPYPIPANEHERLQELLSLDILDSDTENQFEDIVKLAAHVTGAPISLITLLDETRQWFKAKIGLQLQETPRDIAFCSYAIAEDTDEMFIVENAKTDARFYDNPLVTGDPNIHFYAGYPLKTSGGYKLGTLCVLDTKQRQLTQEQKTALELLAKQVVKELELRKANRELRKSNQMLQGILGNMPVIAYRVNADGTIQESVGKGLITMGYTNHQLVGKSAFEILPNMKEILQNALQQGQGFFINEGRENGRDWYFEHYVFPDETNPGGLIGFAIDRTERKHIEEELKEAKENAERASLSKSRFVANMSHEIRTPINAILGFAGILKKQELSAESIEYLSYITSSGEILLKLIGDVLDLTKIEEGKFQLQEETFHLKEVLTSNLSPYHFMAKERGLDFELIFDEALPSYTIGDAGKLSQIVVNLIGNALKFTAQGGIKVRFTTGQSSSADQIIHLKVSVSDTGIGIPPEKIGLIFQSFTQADASINRKFGGSGLGLSIVKEMVERLGGQLGVESRVYTGNASEESGSTFWFTLPLRKSEVPGSVQEGSKQYLQNINFEENVHVLLVDDNELNQRLAGVMLKNIGCKVTVAGNGREAIEKLSFTDFQLILMDIQMPLMNGYEATEYIRRQLKLTLPIIGLSANVYKEEIEQCYQSGMNDYLGKPYTEKGFREKVIKWVPVDSKSDDYQAESVSNDTKNLVDFSFLKQLFQNDQEAIQEMVTDFISQQQELLNEMNQALQARDYTKISAISHNMRSSLVTVGLEALREPLLALEAKAKSGDDHQGLVTIIERIQQINSSAVEQLTTSMK